MGPLLHSCVELHELSELSFGVVSVVGPGIDVQNGGPRGSTEGWILGLFAPIGRMVSTP